jgi:hypothetical protein
MSDWYSITDKYLLYESAKQQQHYDAFGGPGNAGPRGAHSEEEDASLVVEVCVKGCGVVVSVAC